MSFNSLLIHSVTVKNRISGATDSRYGDEVETYDAGTVYNARVQMSDVGGQQREQLEGGDVISTAFEVFLPANAAVFGTSEIVWGTRILHVTGEPAIKYDGNGPHHIQVSALEVLGG